MKTTRKAPAPKIAILKDLLNQDILFVSVLDITEKKFPNTDFKNTICTQRYNNEDEDEKFFQYMLECVEGNAFLNDGTEKIEYYTEEDYPEYFL